MKAFKLLIYFLFLSFLSDLNAQCPPSKYGIVPVWPHGWSQNDKENWYQTMSEKGMGYLHPIYTWQELATIMDSGQLTLHINYLTHLKESHAFTLHLLLRNPSITYNAIPAAYQGLTFKDSVLVDAFYDFSVEMIDVEISVFDINGKIVAEILDSFMQHGSHSVIWDGSYFSSGTYIIQMKAGSFVENIKCVLIK